MKTNQLYLLLSTALIMLCNACKKEDNFLYKGDILPVSITGYNASSEYLLVKLDTFSFKSELSPNTMINLSDAYTFWGDQEKVNLTISEKSTGKKVLERALKKSDGPTTVNLFYMNGEVSELPQKPSVEEGKNSVIYMFKPTITKYSGAVDIALGKFYVTPRVFEELGRIKNLKANEFSAALTVPSFSTAAGQLYNGQATSVSFRARIYKAGTNELYTEGSAYTWNVLSSTAPLPPASSSASKLYIFEEAPSGVNMLFTKKLEL